MSVYKRILSVSSIFLIVVSCVLMIIFFDRISLYLFPTHLDRTGELVKLTLSVIGGICLLYGLWISNRRAKATEENVKIQGAQINLSLKSQIDERFKNAIEHLGDEREPIILGGISELNQIASEDRNKYADVVFNILCSYIRTGTSIYHKVADDINSTAINTIINCLFKRTENNPYRNLIADLSSSNLAGQNIINCDLSNADLSFCYLHSIENTILDNADLSRADIFGITFSNNSLRGAKLSTTRITHTVFKNLGFHSYDSSSEKQLFSPHCKSCKFENVSFDKIHIFDALFFECIFINCTFNKASLMNSNFYGCGFIDINFSNTEILSKINFSGSMFHNVTMNCYSTDLIFKGCCLRKSSDIYISVQTQLDEQKDNIIKHNDLHIPERLATNCVFGILETEECEAIMEQYNELIKEEKLPIGKSKRTVT